MTRSLLCHQPFYYCCFVTLCVCQVDPRLKDGWCKQQPQYIHTKNILNALDINAASNLTDSNRNTLLCGETYRLELHQGDGLPPSVDMEGITIYHPCNCHRGCLLCMLWCVYVSRWGSESSKEAAVTVNISVLRRLDSIGLSRYIHTYITIVDSRIYNQLVTLKRKCQQDFCPIVGSIECSDCL